MDLSGFEDSYPNISSQPDTSPPKQCNRSFENHPQDSKWKHPSHHNYYKNQYKPSLQSKIIFAINFTILENNLKFSHSVMNSPKFEGMEEQYLFLNFRGGKKGRNVTFKLPKLNRSAFLEMEKENHLIFLDSQKNVLNSFDHNLSNHQ